MIGVNPAGVVQVRPLALKRPTGLPGEDETPSSLINNDTFSSQINFSDPVTLLTPRDLIAALPSDESSLCAGLHLLL